MRRLLIATAGVGLLVGTSLVFAQDQGGNRQGQGQGQGQGQQDGNRAGQERRQRQGDQERRFDPEEMRQRMLERMKEQMGASDEEWQVIQPKLERVVRAQTDARAGGGMGMMMGGPGGPGRGPAGRGPGAGANAENPSEVARASRELRETLQDESAPAEQIQERLTAFRAARQKAEQELKTARDDLQGVLTQRQEAMLVMMGMLE